MISSTLDTVDGLRAYLETHPSLVRGALPPGDLVGMDMAVSRVSGGRANHTYRVTIRGKDDSSGDPKRTTASSTLVIKYSPPNVAANPGVPLPTNRGFFEYTALAMLPPLTSGSTTSAFRSLVVTVRTAKAVGYDASAGLLAITDLGKSARTLKEYLLAIGGLRDEENAGGVSMLEATCELGDADLPAIGSALGSWLASLHEWGTSAAAQALRDVLKENTTMATIALDYTFGSLTGVYGGGATSVGHDDDKLWRDVQAHVRALMDADNNTSAYVIHGDFWTGNVLVISASPESDDTAISSPPSTSAAALERDPSDPPIAITLTVLDWEASNCRNFAWTDVGQMCAEMYQPVFFSWFAARNLTTSSSDKLDSEPPQSPILTSFLNTYLADRKRSGRPVSLDERRMAIIRFGAHVAVWPAMTGWGEMEFHRGAASRGDVLRPDSEGYSCAGDRGVEAVKRLGREYVRRAWEWDWAWLAREGSVLRELALGVEAT